MTEISFHLNIADMQSYTLRLLHKAWRSQPRLVLLGEEDFLQGISAALWGQSPTDFVAHCWASDAVRMQDAGRLVLATPASLGAVSPAFEVLLKLGQGSEPAPGFERFARNPKTAMHGVVTAQYDVEALLAVEALAPGAQLIDAEHTDVRLSQGDGYLMAVLTNYDPLERPIRDALLRLPNRHISKATAYATDLPEAGEPLQIQGDTIYLPTLAWGAFVMIE